MKLARTVMALGFGLLPMAAAAYSPVTDDRLVNPPAEVREFATNGFVEFVQRVAITKHHQMNVLTNVGHARQMPCPAAIDME